jgi:hypothetical protein
MSRHTNNTLQITHSPSWRRTLAVIALTVGLSLLSGTRAFDSLRAASYFLRMRKVPAISVVRLDQENSFTKDQGYVVARAR